ncbi:glycosyltransferase [Tritonibacter mobilis]|uniref:glycosyltransferase n=1 Tax=Tritonibacter mobilis TaxID=379347 RepID=UPI0039A5B8FD
MLQRLISLFSRYSATHMDISLLGRQIIDQAGVTVGFVETVRLRAGKLQVQGWAQAASLRLVLASNEDIATPTIRREDVATLLGLPATLGFELSIPATPEILASSDAPDLIITPLPGSAPISPICLQRKLPVRHRALLLLKFSLALTMSIPDILGWVFTKNPRHRARIKEFMGFGTVQMRTAIDPNLLPSDAKITSTSYDKERIDIILPVYNAFELLQDCVSRIARHTDLPWRLIVVEDCSTDTRIRPFLREWAASHPQAEIFENSRNLGFIGAVNLGLSHALQDQKTSGPVVLLNSDALVPEGWASRLVAPLDDPAVASVTPMSNDAEIFSVPNICVRTILEPGQGEAIDAVAARIPLGSAEIYTPTGVGFCMAMGRTWLKRLPNLDPIFGRGYGEEVDWCQKVAKLGGRHLALPSLFVEHRGGESFGSGEKAALVAKNNTLVASRYPNYDQNVQEFIASDPLLSARLALGFAWAGSLDPARKVPVYLAHAMGGGAEHWLEHQINADLARGRPSVILRVGTSHRWRVELVTSKGRTSGYSDVREDVVRLLSILPRRKIIYSCGVGDIDPIELPDLLIDITSPEDDAEMLFHDFFPLSPSYNLLDSDGVYRGRILAPRTDYAHMARRLDGTAVSMKNWQAAWGKFGARADLVVFSEDSARQVTAVWPDLKESIVLRPHTLRHIVPPVPATMKGLPVVLAILGNIGQQKGAKVVQTLARMRARDGQGPQLVLIGNIDPAFPLPDTIKVHGSYKVDDLPALVNRYGITHWLIPSVWPETFCYTVHEALATSLPVLAFSIGAQGAAVRAAENGIEVPFGTQDEMAQSIRNLMASFGSMRGEY